MTPSTAGHIGIHTRLSRESPADMTRAAFDAKARHRMDAVEEQARMAGEWPLAPRELQRRADELLKLEMAKVRSARRKPKANARRPKLTLTQEASLLRRVDLLERQVADLLVGGKD